MIDLHIHTNASDGQYDVEKIIEIAYENGIDTLAIMDHDTVKAVEKAITLGRKKKIMVIPRNRNKCKIYDNYAYTWILY